MVELSTSKLEFLNSLESKDTVSQFKSIFKHIKNYEDEYKCDLTLLHRNDFIEIFMENDWASNVRTFGANKSMIKRYLKWHFDNNEEKYDNITSVNIKDFNKEEIFGQCYFRNFEEVDKYTKLFLELSNEYEKRTNEITASIIYYIWLGLDYDDIANLKTNDFNYDTKELINKNKKIVVDFDIAELLLKIKARALEKGINKMVYSEESNREYENRKFNEVINVLLGKFNELSNIKTFTYSKLKKSGLYSRIFDAQIINNYGDSESELNELCANYLDEKKSRREKDTYIIWKEWRMLSSDKLLRIDINNILTDMEGIRGKIGQEDYWTFTKTRIGQGCFRDFLIQKNNCECAICSINTKEALIASHIKEFASCEDDECYDINNGLLLCANHDKLFDQHLISFDKNGIIMISPKLSKDKRERLNIKENTCIKPKVSYDETYMNYHRTKYNLLIE